MEMQPMPFENLLVGKDPICSLLVLLYTIPSPYSQLLDTLHIRTTRRFLGQTLGWKNVN